MTQCPERFRLRYHYGKWVLIPFDRLMSWRVFRSDYGFWLDEGTPDDPEPELPAYAVVLDPQQADALSFTDPQFYPFAVKEEKPVPPMRANPCQCEIYQTCSKCVE